MNRFYLLIAFNEYFMYIYYRILVMAFPLVGVLISFIHLVLPECGYIE